MGIKSVMKWESMNTSEEFFDILKAVHFIRTTQICDATIQYKVPGKGICWMVSIADLLP